MASPAGALLRSSANHNHNPSTSSLATTPACIRATNPTCPLRQALRRYSNRSRPLSPQRHTSLMESHSGQEWAYLPCSPMPRDSTQSPCSTETTPFLPTLTCQAQASSISMIAFRASNMAPAPLSVSLQHQALAPTSATTSPAQTRLLCRTTAMPTIVQTAPYHHPSPNPNGLPNGCNDGWPTMAFPRIGKRHSGLWAWKAQGSSTSDADTAPRATLP